MSTMDADATPSRPPYGQPPDSANDPFRVGPAYDPPLGDSPAPPPRDLEGPKWSQGPLYGEAPQKRRGQAQARVTDVTISVVLPWLLFFIVVSLFLFVFQELPSMVWIVVALSTSLAFLFLGIGACARHSAFVAIGFLCFTSVVVGTGVGLWLHSEYLERYYELADGVEYWDVRPNTGDAKRTKDAAVIHFSPGTFVDDRRTLGFVAGGGILCLAPVVAPSAPGGKVQYWAAGQDCCEMRSNFDCGTSREAGAVTAVVERPGPRYRRAIAQAESVYGASSAEGAQVVSFVADPKAVLGDLWDEALTLALISMIMDLCMCVVAGLLVSQILSVQASAGKLDRGL